MLQPGQHLAQFELLAKLGQGGMGVVFRALDARLQRQVALKVMAPAFAHDAERRARFLREARAAAAVTHPNIATVYQVDEAEGQIFIAMELVDGQSLDAWLSGRQLGVEQALSIVRDLSLGVASAHERGIVHRDLKPANVMITRAGQLKILDFGIAKMGQPGASVPSVSGTQPMAATQTEEGHVLGTAGYMSPEQAMGAPVDARSDVFSIGVLLYELLTGQRAFRGDTYAAVVLSTTRDNPPLASSINPRVSPPLQQLLDACLAKDARHRLPNAEAVARSIERLLGNPEVASGATVPAAAPVGAKPWQPNPPTTHAALAGDAPKQNRSKTASLLLLVFVLGSVAATGVAVAGILAWQFTDWFTPALRSPEVGLAALAKYEDPADSTSSNLSAPFWATAERDFETAQAQRGAPKRWAAAAEFTRGQRLFSLGQLDEAEAQFTKSLEKDDQFALPWVALSSTYLRKKKLDQAIEAAEKAQVLAPKLWPAVAAGARAYAHKSQMDFAIQEYRRAVAMAPGKPYLMSELALTYHASGMDSDAERYAKAALELDPDVVPALILLAERALEANQGARALEYAKRATAVEPRDVSAWLARGDAEQLLDEPNAARQAWEKALRLWRETRQRGAPRERLGEVQAALDDDRLPDPRGGAKPAAGDQGDERAEDGAPGERSARSTPAARSAPAARSRPKARSKPQPPSAPRSTPAAKPAPRSRPDPSNFDF